MTIVKFPSPALYMAKLVQEVTSITLVNNTAKTVDTTVPAGKRWILLSIRVTNDDDVARDVTVWKYKEAAKTNALARLLEQSLGQYATAPWPNTQASASHRHVPANPFEVLDAGNTISVTWAAGGASSGSVDADGLVIEYLEIDI